MSEISEKLFKNFGQLMQQNHRMMGFMSMNRGGRHFSGQQRVLAMLKKNNGELTTGQLAEELDIRPSSVSELIKKLEKAELVIREKDENDKRITLVSLTEKGEEMSAKSTDRMDEFSEMFFKGLDEIEQIELNRLIEKLLSSSEDQREEWRQQMAEFRENSNFEGGFGRGGRGPRRGHHPFADDNRRKQFMGQSPEFSRNETDFFDRF